MGWKLVSERAEVVEAMNSGQAHLEDSRLS
jgi:exonuclease VII small subunit